MDFLLQYYGLDWLSMLGGFAGAWLITEKKKIGFLFTLVSLSLALVTAIMADQYGFVAANIISAGIAIRGFCKWTEEEKAFAVGTVIEGEARI